jgi:hypothetical protein
MAAPITSTFDPVAYKATTRQQWQAAAEAWHRWGPPSRTGSARRPRTCSTSPPLARARGCWTSPPGRAGRRWPRRGGWARPGGCWPPTSPRAILDYAAAEARRAGLANVATRAMDGEQLDVDPGTYDAVISRVGLIYFPDQQRALSGMRQALRPSGRVAAIVYSTPDRNQFFSLPVAIIRRRAQLPPPAPGQPGPFSLGGPGVLEAAFTAAGFRDVVTRLVAAPLRLASAAECVRFERESFGALHQMLAGLDEAGREAAWTEIAETLARFEGPNGFEGPCEMVVAAGIR